MIMPSSGYVAGSRRHIHKQIVAVPQNVRPELLHHAGNHRAAPDDGVGLIFQQQVDGHDLDPGPGLHGQQGVLRSHGVAVNAESLGDGGAGNIGVHNAHLIAAAAHGDCQLAGDHGFAHAALAGHNSVDLAHMGVRVMGFQQRLRLPRGAALPAGGAVMCTLAHID